MPKVAAPELRMFLDKRLALRLNGGRRVVGRLRGFDAFMNLVLDGAVSEEGPGRKTDLGVTVIRGNSVVQIEALDRV